MTEQTPTKLLNKGFISITVINFIVYLVYYLLMVIIAVIAQDRSSGSGLRNLHHRDIACTTFHGKTP